MPRLERVVLGFENPAGTLAFWMTGSPLVAIERLRRGYYPSCDVHADADLRWVLRTADEDQAVALTNLLNGCTREEAIGIAEAYPTSPRVIERLQQLAFARTGNRSSNISEAWRLLHEGTVEVEVAPDVAPKPPPDVPRNGWVAVTEIDDLDCPFAVMPEPACERPGIVGWAGWTHRPFDLAIFDLDGTLLDTRALAAARRGHGQLTDTVLDRARPLTSYGVVVPHELPRYFKEAGKLVAVVTRSPERYARALLDHFGIPYDYLHAPSGSHKAGAFVEAMEQLECRRERTVVFGDDDSDFAAADEIGSWSFGNPFHIPRAGRRLAPDITWWDAETLLWSERWIPDLTYIGEADGAKGTTWHRGSMLHVDEDAWALGRYYVGKHPRHGERLSKAVLDQKERRTRVPRLAGAFDEATRRLHARIGIDAVLSVPTRLGRLDRFVPFRQATVEQTGCADIAVTELRPPAADYKTWGKDRRIQAAADRFRIDADLHGMNVLLIDDVITTGATIGAVTDAARAAGADRVMQLHFGATQ